MPSMLFEQCTRRAGGRRPWSYQNYGESCPSLTLKKNLHGLNVQMNASGVMYGSQSLLHDGWRMSLLEHLMDQILREELEFIMNIYDDFYTVHWHSRYKSRMNALYRHTRRKDGGSVTDRSVTDTCHLGNIECGVGYTTCQFRRSVLRFGTSRMLIRKLLGIAGAGTSNINTLSM